MFQHAAASILAPKEGGNAFRKLINKLVGK